MDKRQLMATFRLCSKMTLFIKLKTTVLRLTLHTSLTGGYFLLHSYDNEMRSEMTRSKNFLSADGAVL